MADELVKQNQALGASLISEADKRNEENRREALLKDVAALVCHRDESLEKSDFYAKAADWYSRKLAAIEAGEFAFNPRTGSIVMTDEDLQRANY
jgi:hypothetical protein